MHKILFLIAAAFLLLPPSHSFGFSDKGGECSKCHTLTKDEATTLLKDLDPNIKVTDVLSSPVKAMWEVDIESGGRKMPVYVDFSKKHLISGGIFLIKEKKDLTRERITEISKVDVGQIPLADALVLGEKNAKHKVIVFDDPD